MEYTTIGAINEYISETVNPSLSLDTVFEVYSVPIFETGHPEYLRGEEIGSTKQIVQKDDVLICKINPRINRIWVVADESDKPNIASSEWIVVRSQEFNPEFLGWYFRSAKFKALMVSEVAGIGGSLTRAQPKRVAGYPVPLIQRGQQDEIVRRLNSVTRIIESRQRQLRALDTLIKARFVEMFGDCRTNPYGWETKALSDVAEVGSSKRVFVEELQESGIPFYRGTEVGALAEGKAIQPELFITPEHYNELIEATGKPEPGDLLMPSICPDGRIWVVNTEEPFYFKDGRVLWVHSIDPAYDPIFLLYTLKDRIMTDYSSIASGTTFAELKIFALKQCQVFDVPIEKQKEFVAFVRQTDKSKLSILHGLEKLETLKKALMQSFFY